MDRRDFFKYLGSDTSSLELDNHRNSALQTSVSYQDNWILSSYQKDRVMVVIQLIGGNDGLNSLIPLDQYGQLTKHRSNILIEEKNILKITDENGFHPALESFRDLFVEQKLCCIQDVGYARQNRSHFRSMDIWNSGSPSDEMWSSGWLGRFLDFQHSAYPDNYPNIEFPDPLSLNIGNFVADTCQGQFSNYSYAINSFEEATLLQEREFREDINSFVKKQLDFLNNTTRLTNKYTERVLRAANKGSSLIEYSEKNLLAQQLKMVAQLISGGLGTRIYTLTMGGFDTHAFQTAEKTDEGWHANLLTQLSEAISLFQRDLEKLKISDKVLLFTYSEFGRQIASNHSKGTDHGDAAPMFITGSCLKNSIVGKNPVIRDELEHQAGVPLQYDFRDVYGTLLKDWLGIEKVVVESIFKKPLAEIDLLV